MFYQAVSEMRSSETELQQENIEVAIKFYEGASSLREEERWLILLERALQSLLVFTAEDLYPSTRIRHKEQHAAALNGLRDQINKRKNGVISKIDLAQEMRRIYSTARGDKPHFRPLL